LYLPRTHRRAEGLKSGVCTIQPVSMPKARTASPIDQPPLPAIDLPASYEAAMAELERLVAQLESGTMPLEQLLTGYQRGAALLQFCRDKLQAVEDQIQVLDNGTIKAWKPQ
jgi:exodeoxyribonuclease VII small subunit